MTYNDEMRIPYVSKELCEYLRQTYSLQSLLSGDNKNMNAERAMGVLIGINEVIERLEAIQVQQEENDGIRS